MKLIQVADIINLNASSNRTLMIYRGAEMQGRGYRVRIENDGIYLYCAEWHKLTVSRVHSIITILKEMPEDQLRAMDQGNYDLYFPMGCNGPQMASVEQIEAWEREQVPFDGHDDWCLCDACKQN